MIYGCTVRIDSDTFILLKQCFNVCSCTPQSKKGRAKMDGLIFHIMNMVYFVKMCNCGACITHYNRTVFNMLLASFIYNNIKMATQSQSCKCFRYCANFLASELNQVDSLVNRQLTGNCLNKDINQELK